MNFSGLKTETMYEILIFYWLTFPFIRSEINALVIFGSMCDQLLLLNQFNLVPTLRSLVQHKLCYHSMNTSSEWAKCLIVVLPNNLDFRYSSYELFDFIIIRDLFLFNRLVSTPNLVMLTVKVTVRLTVTMIILMMTIMYFLNKFVSVLVITLRFYRTLPVHQTTHWRSVVTTQGNNDVLHASC